MFDTDTTGKPWLGGRPAGVSLLIHAAAILLAFLAGGPIAQLVVQPRAVALTVPPSPVKKSVKLPARPLRPARPPIPPPSFAFKRPVTPALHLPVIELPEAPVVEPGRAIEPVPELSRTRNQFTPPVKTGEFAPATPAIPTRTLQPPLQTSTFNSLENSQAATPRARLATSSSGFDSAGVTEEHRKPADVSQSGFSTGAPAAAALSPAHAITKSSFGDVAREAPGLPSPQPQRISSLTTPAEILSKPRPVYTGEARTLAIEGEVLVEVVLEASGRVRVVRLVKGLGHGLDENAEAAAQEIRFRPASKEGAPADSTAVVHILFQLAY